MTQFITALAQYLEAQGVGEIYSTSGVSIQDGMRRDLSDIGGPPPTIALVRQGPGDPLINALQTNELYGVQVLVDSETVSGARETSRTIFSLLSGVRAQVISGFRVMSVQAIDLPADIGVAPGASERFTVSTNYTARIVKQ